MTTRPLMADIGGEHYFDQKPLEQGGEIYEKLGIKLFQRFFKFLRTWFKDGKNDRGYFVWDTSEDGLRKFIEATKTSESAHTTFLMALNAFIAVEALDGNQLTALGLFFLNIGFNVYPIMLQRYIRPKIQAILERRQTRSGHASTNDGTVESLSPPVSPPGDLAVKA